MPGHILIVDFFGLVLAVIGFNMAFRQRGVRRMLGRPAPSRSQEGASADPLAYGLRIAGVMIMIFGVVIAGMVTLVGLS
jgi:nitrogen fixation protein FixH